jgi:hypothetical protein
MVEDELMEGKFSSDSVSKFLCDIFEESKNEIDKKIKGEGITFN